MYHSIKNKSKCVYVCLLQDQRQYLRYLHGILNVCKSVDAENILSQWPSSYVYENEDLYSMHVSKVIFSIGYSVQNRLCMIL